jgi:Phage tail tube protein
MPLASTSLVVLRAIKEAAFGVTPATGNSSVLRIKSESLNFDITKTASAEINASRGISSVTPTSAKASGALGIEMRHIGLEDFLESAMQAVFTDFGTIGLGVATPTTSITANTITATAATTGTSLFTVLAQGQWFRVLSAGANNGKIVRVSPSVAPTATALVVDANTPLAVSAGESIQIQAARLTHGTTQSSWTIEKNSTDIGVFLAYTGMTPDKFSLKVAKGALSEASFDFIGKSALESNTTVLPGTPVAADTYDVHSGVAGATNAVWLNNAPVAGTFVTSVDLSFSNGLRAQEAIGTLGAVGVGSGTIDCKLTMSIYFADKSTFTTFRTNANSMISFASTDLAGNGYVFTAPVCNLTTWKSTAGAKDQDQMVDVTFTALLDVANPIVSLRKLLFIDRFGAVA